MRFMMLMFPGARPDAEGASADEASMASMASMMAFNEELTKAGVLLAVDALQPTSKGMRLFLENGRTRVVDGPFAGSRDVVGAYWMLQVKSKAEAVEWARRCPLGETETLELRQVFEMADVGLDPAGDVVGAGIGPVTSGAGS